MSADEDKPIADGQVVFLNYVLRDDGGDVIDQSEPNSPLLYLHGAGNIVPGLERELAGKAPGANLKVTVAPEDGYGEREGPDPQTVPRGAFPAEVELEPGMPFVAEGEDGRPFPIWIAEVSDDSVTIDKNHPLAGKTLNFEVEVVRTRQATADEIQHGHPHGPDGHAHHH